jgi:regulator of chromosome condensation
MGFDDNYQSIGMVIRDDDSVEKPTEIPPTFMPIGGSGIDTSDGKMKMGNHVHAVSAGGLHSVALIDGVPYSWGNSDHGTLGRLDVQGDDMMAATPGPITGFRKRDPKNYGSIISEDGQIVQIVAGEAQTLFVSASGSVYQCGSYKDMDSGTFSDVDPLQNSSSAKGANLRPVHVGQLEQPVLSVFTQGSFNAALLSDGTLMTWGFGNHGELARSATMMTKPNKKDGSYDLEKNFFYKLAVDPETGEEFLKPNLSIVEQQFLKPQPVLYDPQLPILKREVIAVATGQYHLLVVARDPGSNFGKVYASGMNNYGQLGTGDVRDRHALTHVETLASENIVNVAAGEHHSLVLTHDRRRIYSFGRADYGQLGIGVMDKASLTGGSRATPQQVYFPEFVHFTRIDCGDRTCFAITKDYELYTWGFNETMATGHPIIPAYDVYRPRKLDLSKIQDHPNAENDPQNQSNRFRNVRVHAVSGGGHHTILLVSKSAGNNENASPK